MIIDTSGTGLDDVDILATDRVFNLATALTTRELCENSVARRNTKGVADIFRQLRVGIAPEQTDIADHFVCAD